MADLTYHNDGNYHWYTWETSDDNNYDYHVRLAANSYHNGGTYFNMFKTLPNINAPTNGEKILVMNGGMGYLYDGAYYNHGPEVTWYGRIQQEFGFASTDPATRLAVGSHGDSLTIDTINNMELGGFPVLLACPSNADGTGEYGVTTTRSHAFVGHGTSVNYFGYVLGEDNHVTGKTGAQVVAKMTGLYGGTCAILDGGGSTQMWYNGTIVRPSTDEIGYRLIKNALVLYRTPKQFTITTSVVGQGTVSGGGTYYKGAAVTLTATPSQHYQFSSWSDGSVENPRTFSARTNKTLTATFIELPEYTVNVNIIGQGTVSGSGLYHSGDTVTLTATAGAHYSFTSWSTGETTPTITKVVTENVTYTATFTEDTKYTISGTCLHGTVTGTGDYYLGDVIILTCIGDSGYTLDHWSDSVTDNPRVVTVTGAATYNAIMKMETVQYTLTLQNEHGTTTGSGTYDEFETVLVSTIPEYNYLFTNWTEDGVVYSTDKNTTVTMTKDITLVANTEKMTLANSGIAFMV